MKTDRLEAIEARFKELEAQLSDPAVISDMPLWTKVVKEHSSLRPVMDSFERLKKAEDDLRQAREIIDTETDEEMKELAREEADAKKKEVEAAEHELKILLLPADPDDHKIRLWKYVPRQAERKPRSLRTSSLVCTRCMRKRTAGRSRTWT